MGVALGFAMNASSRTGPVHEYIFNNQSNTSPTPNAATAVQSNTQDQATVEDSQSSIASQLAGQTN